MADRNPPDAPDAELLDRYLAGECTELEGAVVRRWLMANPAAARALEQFVRRLDAGDGAPAPPDAAASWATLRARLRVVDEAPPAPSAPPASLYQPSPDHVHEPSSRPRRRRSFEVRQVRGARWWWGGMAAAATLLAAAALERAGRPRDVAPPPAAGSYATATMQRADIQLSDGTRVRLAPASRLRVASDFGHERRDVYLEGEAFFDVAHDARPFTVFAGNASARDLGTAFSVRGYAEDSAVRVIVREGEVALSGVGRLAAGDLGRLTSRRAASDQHGDDVALQLGCLEGRHGYRDAPLGDVLRDLARWYGTEVQVADSALLQLPFTGVVEGRRPKAAIDLVASTLGLTVRREGARTLLVPTTGRTPRARTRS